MKNDIATLRDKLKQLKALHDSGTIDAQAYESGKAKIERDIVDKVLADASTATAVADQPRASGRLVMTLAAAVLVVAGAGYWWTGAPGAVSGAAPAAAVADGAEAAPPHSTGNEEFAAAVDKLAQRMKEQPDNVEGWAMLARSYTRLGRLPEALEAYAKAMALRGDDARLLADYADALAVRNNRSLEGEPLKLIERALKIDPNNLKALSLAGTAAFDRKDYPGAVRYWEKVAQVAPPDSAFLTQVQASIAEARQLGGMPAAAPVAAAAATPPQAVLPATAPAATGSGTAIRGTVRLAPALAKLAAPSDTVFIFVRPAEGQRMPLAILRKQVQDLPVTFSLDDGMAMSPAARLSMFPKVVVSARVSKTGQAAPSAGDLSGQSPPVANDAAGVLIEINEIVKN